MSTIDVRVVSAEEADRGTAEFWLDDELFAYTRLEDGELVLRIEPRADGAALVVGARSLATALAQAKALLEGTEVAGDRATGAAPAVREPPAPAAVTFLTTEHFTLQGARAATIAESTGRATMFLASVSGGLVALGLVATAARVSTAFYVFALVLLPTLAFVGVVSFERALQTGIEDYAYAKRIATLRGFYFDYAPELAPYLMSVPPDQRLHAQGLQGGRWQSLRTIAGMIAVLTAVLAGSSAAIVGALVFGHRLGVAVALGAVVAAACLIALLRFEAAAWRHAQATPLSTDDL
jgi:hypothetical protein